MDTMQQRPDDGRSSALGDMARIARRTAFAAALAATLAPGVVGAGSFELITTTTTPAVLQPNGSPIGVPDASSDGRYVVFSTAASNLVPTDANGACSDIVLFDAQSSALALEHVSVNDAGIGSSGCNSVAPQISGDGRYVVFVSSAFNLDSGSPGGLGVYLRDRQLGTTRRVDLDASGVPLDGHAAAFSRGGRYLAIWSATDGLIHRKDLQTGSTEVVSVDANNAPIAYADGNGEVSPLQGIAISDDGQVVAFSTAADVPSLGDTDGALDVYVRVMPAENTLLASRAADGSNPSGHVHVRARGDRQSTEKTTLPTEHATRWLSGDGRRLVFSTPDALVAGDTGAATQIDGYLFDRGDGTGPASVSLLTVAGDGTRLSSDAFAVSISSDGSRALLDFNTLIDDAGTSIGDLAVKPTAGGSLLSALRRANLPNSYCCVSSNSTLSGDGSFVVSVSLMGPAASPDSRNGTSSDVLRSPVGSGNAVLVSRPDGNAGNIAAAGDNGTLYHDALRTTISADGRLVAFVSPANNLVANDGFRAHDVFVRDRTAGATRLIEGSTGLSFCTPGSLDMSQDGRYLLFSTCASLLPASTGSTHIYRQDLSDNTLLLVSRGEGADSTAIPAGFGSLSNDGQHVLFAAFGTNPVGDGLGSGYFLRNLATGSNRRVNLTNAGTAFPINPIDLVLSGDALSMVTTESQALDAADANGSSDVYLLDLVSMQWDWISRPDQSRTFSGSQFLSVSADGSRVLFLAIATETASGSSTQGLFLRDRDAGTTTRVDVRSDGSPLRAGSGSILGLLSDNGRFVAFEGVSTDFIAGEGTVANQVYIRDLQSAVTVRVTADAGGQLANGFSRPSKFSADGRWLMLTSAADNLVDGDANGRMYDLFLVENPLFDDELVSDVDTLTPDSTEPSLEAQVSGDGRFVVFESLDPSLHAPCPGVANPPLLCGAGGDACPAPGVLYVFRLDSELGCVDLVSTDDAMQPIKMFANRKGGAADALLGKPSLSADGTLVAFAADMTAVGKLHGESPAKADGRRKIGGLGMLLRNMLTGTTSAPPPPVGVAASTGTDQGDGIRPQVAANGSAVVFTGQVNGQNAVLQVQLKPGGAETFCVSCKLGASGSSSDPASFTLPLGGMAQNPSVSADGTWVAFETDAADAGDTPSSCNNDPDGAGNTSIILRNMLTGSSQVVSQPQGTACQAGSARKPRLDYAGARMVFESTQPLTPGASARSEAYYLDLGANRMQQVSTDGLGGQVDAPSGEPTISGDGRSVAFTSRARRGFGADLSEDLPDTRHIVVRQMRSSIVRRLSRNLNGIAADGDSARPSLSYTGEYVVFDSAASNLSASDNNGATTDVFVRINPVVRGAIFGSSFE